MKKPIAWHKNNIKNFEDSLNREIAKLKIQQRIVEHMEAELTHRKETVVRAVKEGLAEFDADKYNKKREKSEQ